MPETRPQVIDPRTLARDFDEWRAAYDTLTFQDQRKVYAEVAKLYPLQRAADVAQARQFFGCYQPQFVVELGGWDGWLASRILSQDETIRAWSNYDLISVPQVPADVRYYQRTLPRPFWETDALGGADAFVAAHVIEHIRFRELVMLVEKLTLNSVSYCLVEAPIQRKPTDWTGYHGTHILEVGWDTVDPLFARGRYKIAHAWEHGRYYIREGRHA